MEERHQHLFGPFTTYFVLGSYEQPSRGREPVHGDASDQSGEDFILRETDFCPHP